MKKIFLYALAYIFSGSVVYAVEENVKEGYPDFWFDRGLSTEIHFTQGVGTLILEFAGTKNAQGVCKDWDKIIWGTDNFPGIGHFVLAQYLVNFDITDEFLKKFSNVESLELEIWHNGDGDDVHVTDEGISALRGVENLTLIGLDGVTNVSCLRGVKHLTLRKLDGVTDVSALRGVENLTLINLHGVTDEGISALGGVKHLTLERLDEVTDAGIYALRGVENLTLCELYNVKDVSALRGVENLTLYYLPGVTDVSCLGGVKHLLLKGLPGVTDVSGLGSVENLLLKGLDGVTDVSCLSGVKNLTLIGLNRVTDVSCLAGVVETLTLIHMERAGYRGKTVITRLSR